MSVETAKIAYDEAVRTLTAQAGVLDNLRARAATVISVAALITTFLGGQVLAKPSLKDGAHQADQIGAAGWVGIIALASAALCAATILWPWKWRFDQSGRRILEQIDAHHSDPEQTLRQMTLIHSRNYGSNNVLLRRSFYALQFSFVLLLVETLAWIHELRR